MQSQAADEARRILDEARKRGIALRLFGGVAVKYHCPSASHRSLQRTYPDLDFIGLGKEGRPIRGLFLDLGYQPNQRFNALHGRTRLIFEDPVNQRTVDVFLDIFRMCHEIPIGKRLTLDIDTVSISDLLLTKLQVVETNEKDIRDMIAILHDHDVKTAVEPGEREVIDADYIRKLTAKNWGLSVTITRTLRRVQSFLIKYDLSQEDRVMVDARITRLVEAVSSTPKSLRWKLRNIVGEKIRWYDLPEIPIRTESVG